MTVKTKQSMKWSPAVMRVYQKYPAAFKTAQWDEIVRLANLGRIKDAEFLASDHEDKHKSHRAQNVIARRLRYQRVALYTLQRAHLLKIKGSFLIAAKALSSRMERLPNKISSIAPMRMYTRAVIVELRRSLNKIITDLIWQSVLLGVKNMGEAVKPIMRENQESFSDELADIQLLEDRLTMGVSKKLAGKTDGTVDMGSDKWQAIVDGIYEDIVKGNNAGLNVSERIWDLTTRAENDLKRMLATEISKGTSSRDIADRINKYVFTKGVDDEYQSGQGIYKSPLANAMRVARTETNRAYSQASASWADNKPWITGLAVTLSAAHDTEDECDDIAGEIYSPSEFADVVPVHPNCMCFATYIIDENYLTGEPDNAPEEENDD